MARCRLTTRLLLSCNNSQVAVSCVGNNSTSSYMAFLHKVAHKSHRETAHAWIWDKTCCQADFHAGGGPMAEVPPEETETVELLRARVAEVETENKALNMHLQQVRCRQRTVCDRNALGGGEPASRGSSHARLRPLSLSDFASLRHHATQVSSAEEHLRAAPL